MEQFNAGITERSATCEKHGEYVQRSIPVLMGRAVWSKCPKCTEEQLADENDRKAVESREKAQAMAEARLKAAGVPERFRDRLIETYAADTPEQNHAKAAALEFVANFREHRKKGTQVVFSGNPGTGKSHLAIAVLREVMKGGTGMYMNVLDMVRMVRDTWRRDSAKSESEVLDTLGSLDLLVLDEVGVQYGTDGEQVILFDVLNRRYRDCRPTILLTNLRSAEFEAFIGPRAFDRLKEGGIWIRFSWESYRGKKYS